MPERLRTDELCRIAVAQHGEALAFVPQELRSAEMYAWGVGKNYRALCVVPYHLRTEELCRIAVAQDGRALYYVPTHLHAAIKPFVKQKQDLPPSPTWDHSLLDRLEEALTLSETPEAERPEEKHTSWIQRKLMRIAERFRLNSTPHSGPRP